MYVRVEVARRPEFSDPIADQYLRHIELALPEIRRHIRWARFIDVYWLYLNAGRGEVITTIQEVFYDPVLNWVFTGGLIPSLAGSTGTLFDIAEKAPHRPGKFWGIEKKFRTGVTDNNAFSTLEAFKIVLRDQLEEGKAHSGSLLLLEGEHLNEDMLSMISDKVFYNELIESSSVLHQGEALKNARFQPDQVKIQMPKSNSKLESEKGPLVNTFPLSTMSDEELIALSKKNIWALNINELHAIQRYYQNEDVKVERERLGLKDPTDVELEVLAQTWSEHCKHKIFAAHIDYTEINEKVDLGIPSSIKGLFKETIIETTAEMKRPWLLSVFKDNAGIIALNEDYAFCMKVETHNSPSALDPYGGALTGIVGVNRDILGCGFGAKPIFNTDVFCVAYPDYIHTLPDGLMHPRRILEGIRKGVEHGGNKSGIPTVNGALVFDDRYLGKPLVFCGTGGIMPRNLHQQKCESKDIQPGDRICMVGGRIGKDGLHGATFSSLALDDTSPSTVVQLGDPITQKRALDFLLEARNKGLYRTLTDNGAGGLSSSVGELAEMAGGAVMDVFLAKTKYPGLMPFELVVSESQERMTVVVPEESLPAFLNLAEERNSEVSVIGKFQKTNRFDILYNGKMVSSLRLDFLHKGVPQLQLKAQWENKCPHFGSIHISFEKEAKKYLTEILSRPNICSKEWLIRQYDHEVQGMSVVKPLHSVDHTDGKWESGPNDGAVQKLFTDSWLGVAVACGLQPKLSDIDPYLMAQASVDEAIRNLICVGGEFGSHESVCALVDNFCWPDPVEDEKYCGDLVRACFGMKDAALALKTPFISGKDSMKNDYKGKREGKPLKISVPPTLLITAVSKVTDIRNAKTSDFKDEEDEVFIVGPAEFGLIGSELHQLYSERLIQKGGSAKQVVLPTSRLDFETVYPHKVPRPDWQKAEVVYRWLGRSIGSKQNLIKSVHDISDGGLLVALSECLIARRLGLSVDISNPKDLWEFCFGEGFHTFVVSCRRQDSSTLMSEWREYGVPYQFLGSVISSPRLQMKWTEEDGKENSFECPTSELNQAWKKEGYWQ